MKSQITFETYPIRIQNFRGDFHYALLMFNIIDHKGVVWHYSVSEDGRLQTLSMDKTIVYHQEKIQGPKELLKKFPAFVKIKEEDTWSVLRNEEVKQLDHYARPVLQYIRSKGIEAFSQKYTESYTIEGSNTHWVMAD